MEIYNKLTEYIKNSNNILIMTHKNPDLDGISSSICLMQIIKSFNKDVKIYLNKKITNKSVNKMLVQLEKENIIPEFTSDYKGFDLLIILDVNKKAILENDKIIDAFDNIIVIDHHIKSKNYIEGTINYVNANLSSIAEFATDYSRYLNKQLKPCLATSLLAAIEIDTNNYTIKTNAQTHIVASYLMDQGADNIVKQEILKEDKDAYLKRQELLKNTKLYDDLAICLFDNKKYEKEELAMASEELISFEGIESAFTIANLNTDLVGISARSTGKLDVEQIMEKLGGGGHTTEAAVEINNHTLEEVKNMLLEVLK